MILIVQFGIGDSMRASLAAVVGSVVLLASGIALAQNGSMMNGNGWEMGWMGGLGGIWGPIALVVAIVAIVALLMRRKGK
jgi:uncharacterized membrane protein